MQKWPKAALVLVLFVVPGCGADEKAKSTYDPAQLESLAQSLTDQGWVLYGKTACRLCEAQLDVFGNAARHIVYVECDPFAKDSQADRCVENGVNTLPTWIREVDGKEVERLEDYYPPEELAEMAGCEFQMPGAKRS